MENPGAGLADMHVSQWLAEEKARKERTHSRDRVRDMGRTIITISRQYGSGALEVAKLAAQMLGSGWEVWGHEIADAIAAKANVKVSVVEDVDEHSMSTQEQILRYVTNYWEISPEIYRRNLVAVLRDLGRSGKKIIVGHGSAFVLRDALSVRLSASEAFRIQRVMEYEKTDAVQARKRMIQVDADRARFNRSLYHQDVDNPDNFSMNLKVDQLGFAVAASAIAAAMRTICADLPSVRD